MPNNTWVRKANPLVPVVRSAGVGVGGKLYIVGDGTPSRNATQEYDPALDSWVQKAVMPTAREALGAGAVGGRVYAVGGYASTALQALEEYDPVLNTWTARAVMPTSRYALGVATAGEKLYAIGGRTSSFAYTGVTEVYDPGTNSWSTAASLPAGSAGLAGKYELAATGRGGKVHSVGGANGSAPSGTTDHFEYDPALDVWTSRASMVEARSTHVAGTVAGLILVTGDFSSTEAYDPTTNSWEARADNPSSLGPDYASSGVAGNDENDPFAKFYVVGGSSESQKTFEYTLEDRSEVVLADTVARIGSERGFIGEEWAPRAPVPAATQLHAHVALDGKVYVFGGTRTQGDIQATTYEYDPETDTWVQRADMVYAQDVHCTAVVGGKIYSFGGDSNAAGRFQANQEYNPATNAWTAKADLLYGVYFGAGAAAGGKLYATGDSYPFIGNARTQQYDPATDTWTRKADMRNARVQHVSEAVDGRVYVIAGADAIGNPLPTEEYDPATNTWTEKATIQTDRAAASSGVIEGLIYVFGGWNGQILRENEAYDPLTDTWSSRWPMPIGRYYMGQGSTAVGSTAFLMGGSMNPETSLVAPTSVHESYATFDSEIIQADTNVRTSSVVVSLHDARAALGSKDSRALDARQAIANTETRGSAGRYVVYRPEGFSGDSVQAVFSPEEPRIDTRQVLYAEELVSGDTSVRVSATVEITLSDTRLIVWAWGSRFPGHVFIGSQEVPVADGISVEDRLAERSVASFTVVDRLGSFHFVRGQAIRIEEDNTGIVFSGFIENSMERGTHKGTLFHEIECVDNTYLADKRLVARGYVSMSAGAIVQDLLDTILAEEGVTAGNIQPGPEVRQAVFVYRPVSQAFQQLADKAGFVWWIDHERKLQFVARSTYQAPWTVTGRNIRDGTLTVSREAPMYRNRQYVRAGKAITDPQTESFKGDGTVRTFTVGYPIAEVPTVTLNGVPQTVGIKGLDTGKQWYWNKGDPVITQEGNNPAIGSADILQVTYKGLFDVVVRDEDEAAILDLKQVEGVGTGIVEDVIDKAELTGIDASLQEASALLGIYAKHGRRVQFQTRRLGLKAGQIVRLDLPEHAITPSHEFLIECVTTEDEGPVLWHTVTAVEGPLAGSWAALFANFILRVPVVGNVGEESTLVLPRTDSENWRWTEETTTAVFACPNVAAEPYPSETLYPC